MKVSKMNLTILHNEEHFQFMSEVKHLFEQANADTYDAVRKIFPTFADLYKKEDIALELIRKHDLTDTIAEADAKRDSIYRGLVLMIESCLYSPDGGKAKAAEKINTIIKHYGDFRKKSYNEETASIYNFLQDIKSRSAADVTLLKAEEWMDGLEAANEAFDTLMKSRYDDKAGQEAINLRDTRKGMDKLYIEMIDLVNASILLKGAASYTDLVNKLNTRIDYYKNTVAQRKGRAAAKS